MLDRYDVMVIGGGLHGLSAALQLARRGASVAILERTRIGRHSSGASAAGVRTLNRGRAELPASLAAMDMWHDISALVGDDCGFHAHGQLQVAETQAELASIRQRVDALRKDGFTHEEIIDAHTVQTLVPAMAQIALGGAFATRDGAADPHQTLRAFLRAALASGVVVYEGFGVSRFERQGGLWHAGYDNRSVTAPLAVNAAGAWAGQIAAMAGDIIPIETKASMMIVTERIAPFVRPTVISASRKLSFKQSNAGTLLIGGGRQGRPDLDNGRSDVDMRLLAKSAAAATALFPSVGKLRVVRTWAGLEAKTSDNMAIAGLSPSAPGLMHLFGFSGHGFQLVPSLGLATAQLLMDGRSQIDITGLSPERLMGR